MRGAATLLCGAVLVTSGCGNGPGRDVAMPPPRAAPGAVVATYLDALDAHDIDTARRLLTTGHAREVEAAEDSWFSNVESISDVHVRPAFPGPRTHGTFPERVTVPVSFELRQHHEVSMPDGRTVWSYVLVRNEASDRWIIADEGMG